MAAITNACYTPLVSSSIQPRRLAITKPSFYKPLPLKLKPISIKSSSPPSCFKPILIRSVLRPSSSYAVKVSKSKTLVETLTVIPSPKNSIVRTVLTAVVTAAAVFFARLSHRPVLAASLPVTVQSSKDSNEQVSSLRAQMIAKLDNEEYDEAFDILEELLEIQPEEIEWQIYKGRMLAYDGDDESARSLFNDIIERYPLLADAYKCLLMLNSCEGSEIEEIKDMLEAAIGYAEGENLRELKLVYADCHDKLWNLNESLRVYDELITEDPRDFRPYLGKWALLYKSKDKKKAAECLEKYKTLVPKDHPSKKQSDNFVKKFAADCDSTVISSRGRSRAVLK